MADSPNSRYLHLYVIVRFDIPVNSHNSINSTSLVKAFSTQDAAEREALRLNELNKEKGAQYEVFITRLIA